jgi:hypothetical protein
MENGNWQEYWPYEAAPELDIFGLHHRPYVENIPSPTAYSTMTAHMPWRDISDMSQLSTTTITPESSLVTTLDQTRASTSSETSK